MRKLLSTILLCSLPQPAAASSSTYFGGAGVETIKDTLLWNDYYYVTGSTTSAQFGGAGVQAHEDAYVARIATDLSTVDVVKLGGDGDDVGVRLAMHHTQKLIVFGETNDATGFVADPLGVGGYEDIFVASLDLDLSVDRVVLVGGEGLDFAEGLSINVLPDHSHRGDIYISGKSNSDNFTALAGGAQAARAGILDAYVMRLNGALTAVEQTSFLGGSHGSESYVTVSVSPNGGVYLYGVTNSDDFPTTDGSGDTSVALQQTEGGGSADLFLTLFNPDLTQITASTYLGGDGVDEGSTNIGLMYDDTSPALYVVAESRSTNFPSAGLDNRLRGFVARIHADLSTIIAIDHIAGSSELIDAAFHPDTDELFIVGSAAETLEGTSGGAQEVHGGGTGEVFLARYSHDLATLEQTTFLGGNNHEFPGAMCFNADATQVFAAGYTVSNDFPGVTGGAQQAFAGVRDAFAARFSADLTAMPQATYLGGAALDNVKGLELDPATGKLLMVGETESSNLPFATGTAQTSFGGDKDGFVTLLEPTLTDGGISDLELTKNGPASVAVGETITYNLEVENLGPDPATDVVVDDIMPDGLTVAAVSPAATCTVVEAGPVVDQEHDPGTANSFGVVGNESDKAQTFTAGLSGELTAVEAFVYRTGSDVTASLLIDIRATDAAGVPLESDNAVLASRSIPAGEVPLSVEFFSVDFTASPINVVAGELYAIVLRAETESTSGSPYMWGGTGMGNPYQAGKYFTRTDTLPTWTAVEDVGTTVPDLGFRTEITVAHARVTCNLGALASGDTATVTIETHAPNRDAFIENTAQVNASNVDANPDNNHDAVNTTVGNPQSDGPPVNPPSGDPARCNCRHSTPSMMWLAVALGFAFLRRRR